MNPIAAAMRFYKLRASWLGDGGQPVPQDQAQTRADICLSCPKNQPMPIWEMISALEANRLRRTIELKANMKLAVRGEEGLRVCEPCGCHLATKIWAPFNRIKETTPVADLQKENPVCWIRAEIAAQKT